MAPNPMDPRGSQIPPSPKDAWARSPGPDILAIDPMIPPRDLLL